MTSNYTNAFLTIAAIDLALVVEFYQHLFDRSPHPNIPNVYAEFQLSGLRLGIFKPKNDREFSNSARSSMSLCIEVENLEAAIDRFHKIGYPPLGEIMTASHGREVYAYDPIGNRIILHQN